MAAITPSAQLLSAFHIQHNSATQIFQAPILRTLEDDGGEWVVS